MGLFSCVGGGEQLRSAQELQDLKQALNAARAELQAEKAAAQSEKSQREKLAAQVAQLREDLEEQKRSSEHVRVGLPAEPSCRDPAVDPAPASVDWSNAALASAA